MAVRIPEADACKTRLFKNAKLRQRATRTDGTCSRCGNAVSDGNFCERCGASFLNDTELAKLDKDLRRAISSEASAS